MHKAWLSFHWSMAKGDYSSLLLSQVVKADSRKKRYISNLKHGWFNYNVSGVIKMRVYIFF